MARFLALLAIILLPGTGLAETGICAHRGDMARAPENTLPALLCAVDRGAHMIEFDVRLTADDRMILLHDDTLDRTTDGQGPVSALTLAEVRKLDAGSWFSDAFAGTRVPTLREALNAIPPDVRCNVHLKNVPGLAAQVARLVAEMGRLEQCVLACTREQISEAREAVPEVLSCNMSRVRGDRSAYVDQTIADEIPYIQLHKREGTENLEAEVRRLHEAGVTVNYFGANDAATVKALAAAGVDYILTDDLSMALEALGPARAVSRRTDGMRPERSGGAAAPWIFNNKFVPGAGCVCPQHEGLTPADARRAHETATDFLDQL